jgi:uncharacterized protein (DUF1800 family)
MSEAMAPPAPTRPSRKRKRKPSKKRKPAAKQPKLVCRTVTKTKRVKGRKRKVRTRVCARPKAKPGAGHKPRPPAFPPPAPLPEPPAAVIDPPADPAPSGPAPQFGPFGVAEAERLLWRAGFGPRPGDARRLADMGLEAAVAELLSPPAEQLQGPAPVDDDGAALAPLDLWGHDHLWWLDRMVRSNQPLVERMTLVWHDWFATSRDKVQVDLMLAQNALFRRSALASFGDLLRDVTIDPAMLDWLDGIDNTKNNPNENFAREVMELFALGANRGAYTEDDIRNAARALTGWRADWSNALGLHNFRFVASRHDAGTKTIFGQTGALGWEDVVRLCLEHDKHASFFVTKLWGYFIPTAPDEGTQAAMQEAYVASGRQVRPVLEIILKHPDLYRGPTMVKPPVVFCAGLLRAVGRGVDTTAWAWLSEGAGQVLFRPPNVSGWDAARWLDTSTWKGRWELAAEALQPTQVDPWVTPNTYSDTEDGATALAAAVAHVGSPSLTAETAATLREFADTSLPAVMANWQKRPYRAMRQNALRLLIATAADHQTC